jgi:hypothetical protein
MKWHLENNTCPYCKQIVELDKCKTNI